MATALDAYHQLLDKVNSSFDDTRTAAIAAQDQFSLSLSWLEKYQAEYENNPARRLIISARSAAIEAVSAVSLGLARPAVFSLRTYFELFLMFLYYRDHPRELVAAESEIEFMKLPGDIGKYLKKYYRYYDDRWKLLDGSKARSAVGGYDRMSGIVHGSSQITAPRSAKPVDVHTEPTEMAPLLSLIGDISEELSDFAVAAHEANWMSLPVLVQENLAVRGIDTPFKSLA